MAFGKIQGLGFAKDKKQFKGFTTKTDNYTEINKYYFGDGSGQYDWRDVFSATGSFYDDFTTYDLVGTWNENKDGAGGASTTDNILNIVSTPSGKIEIYSTYQSQLLRDVGKITLEVRARMNTNAIDDFSPMIMLGNTSDFEDTGIPLYHIRITPDSNSADTNESHSWSNGSGTTIGSWACTNNSWHTYKIVLNDGATPTAKIYMDNVLKCSGNINKSFRDLNLSAWFFVKSEAGEITNMDIAWVKMTGD